MKSYTYAINAIVIVALIATSSCTNSTADANQTHPTPAPSESNPQESSEVPNRAEKLELCKEASQFAGKVMEARQAGIAMSRLMAMDMSDEMASTAHQMIIQAYERPRMRVEENKKVEIENFENEWHLLCVKEIKP